MATRRSSRTPTASALARPSHEHDHRLSPPAPLALAVASSSALSRLVTQEAVAGRAGDSKSAQRGGGIRAVRPGAGKRRGTRERLAPPRKGDRLEENELARVDKMGKLKMPRRRSLQDEGAVGASSRRVTPPPSPTATQLRPPPPTNGSGSTTTALPFLLSHLSLAPLFSPPSITTSLHHLSPSTFAFSAALGEGAPGTSHLISPPTTWYDLPDPLTDRSRSGATPTRRPPSTRSSTSSNTNSVSSVISDVNIMKTRFRKRFLGAPIHNPPNSSTSHLPFHHFVSPTSAGPRKRTAPSPHPHLSTRTKKIKLSHRFYRSEALLFGPPTSPPPFHLPIPPATTSLLISPPTTPTSPTFPLSTHSPIQTKYNPTQTRRSPSWWPSISRSFGDGTASRMGPDESAWVEEGGWNLRGRLEKGKARVKASNWSAAPSNAARRLGRKLFGTSAPMSLSSSTEGERNEEVVGGMRLESMKEPGPVLLVAERGKRNLRDDRNGGGNAGTEPPLGRIRSQSSPARVEGELEHPTSRREGPGGQPGMLPMPVNGGGGAPPLKQHLLALLRLRLTESGASSKGAEAGLRFKKWVQWNSWSRRNSAQLEGEGDVGDAFEETSSPSSSQPHNQGLSLEPGDHEGFEEFFDGDEDDDDEYEYDEEDFLEDEDGDGFLDIIGTSSEYPEGIDRFGARMVDEDRRRGRRDGDRLSHQFQWSDANVFREREGGGIGYDGDDTEMNATASSSAGEYSTGPATSAMPSESALDPRAPTLTEEELRTQAELTLCLVGNEGLEKERAAEGTVSI